MNQETIHFNLSRAEYSQLLTALQDLPYKQVKNLIEKLENQGGQVMSPELKMSLETHNSLLENVEQVFQVNDRVRARWKQGSTWYNGTIAAFEHGKYHIRYDDGDQEWTTAEFIEALHHPGEPNAQEIFEIGDRVQARWQQGPTWYNGTIQKVEGNRYFIRYDDGDEEWTTAEFMIKR